MALAVHYNQVTFTPDDDKRVRLQLTLTQPFTISTGLRPNVVVAVVPFHEYDKLKGRPIRRGTLSFHWSRPAGRSPDVAYRSMKIVQVEPGELGVPAGSDVARVVEYRLFISDFRQKIVPPRGGRVNLGLVEPSFSEPVYEVENGLVPPARRSIYELIRDCMRPMDLRYEVIDFERAILKAGVPENLQWFNAWAPFELQKLLDHGSAVFCPQINGVVLIRNIGHGEPVVVPDRRELARASVPEADRRGNTVIFTSAPNAVVETLSVTGPSPDTWEFVIQDASGKWRSVDDAKLIDEKMMMVGGPVATVQKGYKIADQRYRDRVRAQLYHCIRLTDKFTKRAKRILRQQVSLIAAESGKAPEIKVKDVEVTAVRAVLDPNTLMWKTSAEPVACVATHLDARANVIYVDELLGKVEVDGNASASTADPHASFKAMVAGDLRVKLSVEAAVELADEPGRFVPKYYNVGFYTGPSGIINPLAESRLVDEMLVPGEDTVIISRPELRLVTETLAGGGTPTDNSEHLAKKAAGLAQRYLAGVRPPEVIRVKGFLQVELSGTVAEVQLDQGGDGGEGPTTTIKLHSHWTPLGPEEVLGIGRGIAGGEAYPQQLGTMGDHLSLGSASAPQPLVALQPAPAAAPAAGTFPVRLEMDADPGFSGNLTTGANFTYTVWPINGTTKLATKVTPTFTRQVGRLEPARWGLAFIDAGKVQLLVTDERHKFGACP